MTQNLTDFEMRLAEREDAPLLHAAQQLTHVREFVTAHSLAEIEAVIDDPDGEYIIASTAREDCAAFVCLAGLQNRHRSIELEKLAVCEIGQGLGGAFLKRVVADVFERHQPNRLWLDVFPDNERARRLYKKTGFVEEGLLRENYFWDGEYRSVVIMSILAREL